MSFIIKCPKCGEEQEFKSGEYTKGTIDIEITTYAYGGESSYEMSIGCNCGNSIEYESFDSY